LCAWVVLGLEMEERLPFLFFLLCLRPVGGFQSRSEEGLSDLLPRTGSAEVGVRSKSGGKVVFVSISLDEKSEERKASEPKPVLISSAES